MVIYNIIENEFQITNHLTSTTDKTWQPIDEVFKNRHKSNKEFEVKLIGLDGGIKLTKNEIIYIEELYRIIDSMPMRMSEIKNKK